MFRRHSVAVSPMTKKEFNCHKTQLERSNNREWIKLFLSGLVPLMIGVFTVVTTILQHKLSVQQREQDKQDAFLLRQQSEYQVDNLRKETIFTAYIDDVSKVLLMENETRYLIHIRMKTLTSLRQLDAERKQYLLLFLYESELIFRHSQKSISSLLNLKYADFNDVFFNGTVENQCSFLRLYLPDVYLSNSSFINCYIDRSNFTNAIMYKATFFKTLIIRTSFKSALLNKANFSYSKISYSDFCGASLIESDFTGVSLIRNSVDLTSVNLTGTQISEELLNNSILYNSILPNGSWGVIDTKNLVINGDAELNCTTTGNDIVIGWNVSTNGEIKIFPYNNSNTRTNLGRCYFRVTPFYVTKKTVYASQMIILTNFSLLISTNLARYHASADAQCFASQYVIIVVYFIDFNGLKDSGVSSVKASGTKMETMKITGIIRSDIRSVQLLIIFNNIDLKNSSLDENYCICDNVKFTISKI